MSITIGSHPLSTPVNPLSTGVRAQFDMGLGSFRDPGRMRVVWTATDRQPHRIFAA